MTIKRDRRKRIKLDIAFCINCHTCVEACFYSHDGISNLVFESSIPAFCRNCSQPLCREVCPTGAISEIDGVWIIDKKKCVGCKSCVIACPFGAIPSNLKDNVFSKCDFCIDKGVSQCIISCPTGALSFENDNFKIDSVTYNSTKKK